MNAHARHSADASTVEESLAIQEEMSKFDSDAATALAMQNTLLTPRFYTTDFDEMDAITVEHIRDEWDPLIAEMASDPNKGPFQEERRLGHGRLGRYGAQAQKGVHRLSGVVLHGEFSGCVLYKEMKRRGNNKEITHLFQLMARDEARHAGFINDALREAGSR